MFDIVHKVEIQCYKEVFSNCVQVHLEKSLAIQVWSNNVHTLSKVTTGLWIVTLTYTAGLEFQNHIVACRYDERCQFKDTEDMSRDQQ
jgi:hypothetical protein